MKYQYIVDTETEEAHFVGEKKDNRTVVTKDHEKKVESEQKKSGADLRYNDNDGFYRVDLPPDPSEAKLQTRKLFEKWEDNKQDALARMRELKSKYLYLEMVEDDSFDLAKIEVDQAMEDSVIRRHEGKEIMDMLDGKVEVN